LKTNNQQAIEKIDKMLSEVKLKIDLSRSACAIKYGKEVSNESDSKSSNSFTDSDIKILEENFGKIDFSPKLRRIFEKTKPVNLTKNWYSKPTPPNL
jgi:hypothetical protein